MSHFWIPLLPFVAFFAWLVFFGMRQRKLCPDCGTPLSSVQSPLAKTRRQWIEGGFTCGNCGCEADVSGRKVAAGTPPQFRSLAVPTVLLAIGVIPAILLLTTLFQR